jgi:hypothetical protein
MLISSYKEKKLVDYLKPGLSICIKFYHGLGDTIMFYPCFQYLQNQYPDVKMVLATSHGQERLFGSYSVDQGDYDYVFDITFSCCEFDESLSKYTKAELQTLYDTVANYIFTSEELLQSTLTDYEDSLCATAILVAKKALLSDSFSEDAYDYIYRGLYDAFTMRVMFFAFGTVFVALSFVTMFFVKHGDAKPIAKKSALENLDVDD